MTSPTSFEYHNHLVKIRAALAAHDIDAAQSALDRVPDSWRDHRATRLMHVRILSARGQVDEAISISRNLHQADPSDPMLNRLYLPLLIQNGQAGAAASIFERRVWNSEIAPEIKARLLSSLLAALPDQAQMELLARLESRGGAANPVRSDPALRFRVATAEYRSGLPERALQTLEGESGGQDLSLVGRALRSDILAQLGRPAEALEAAREVALAAPERCDHGIRLARRQLEAGQREDGIATFALALERWPTEAMVLARLNAIAISPGEVARLYAAALRNFQTEVFGDRALREFGMFALMAGDATAAQDAFGRIEDARRAAGATLPLWPTEKLSLSARMRDDTLLPYQIVTRPNAVATALIFPGLYNRFAGFPFHVFDPYLERLPLNVVYLRDMTGYGFLDGIPALGKDQEETATALTRITQDLGTSRTVTIGNSVGGFAALRYGALVGAEAALCFSPPTAVYSMLDKPADAGPMSARWGIETYSPRHRDVLPDVEANPDMRVTLVVGAANPEDMRQARRLTHLRNVTLHTIDDADDHAALPRILMACGRLTESLDLMLPSG
jgi:hypothetical protein